MSTLDIRYNVDVIVEISQLSAPRKQFDLMCIAGQSTIIPVNERVRQYYTTAEMLADGWQGTEPEYKAALLAFDQTVYPRRILVGRWDNTTGAISGYAINDGGSGYSLGDVLTVVQSGGSAGTFTVTAIGLHGEVVSATSLARGSGYTVASALATTVAPSGGTGCKINITIIGETVVQAATAIRAINSDWYALIMTGINGDAVNIKALADWVEAATPSAVYCQTCNLSDIATNVTTDIASVLKALGYKRTILHFSTYGASPDGIAGVIGYAMGQMVGALANSAYTLNFKSIVGINVEAVTSTQFGYIVGKNCNVYVNRGEYYNWFQNGTMANATFFDERIYLDKLVNDITLNVADLFNQTPKVPQTESGVAQIIAAVAQACQSSVRTGFIAPGQWNGQNIMNLSTGDSLPQGFLVQAESINSQSQADRDARMAPPIYAAVKLAGAIHSTVIQVNVNR